MTLAPEQSRALVSAVPEMWTPPEALDLLELTQLYQNIEERLRRRPGSSVAVASVAKNVQTLRLTYNLAWVGATLLGKRVLVLDISDQTHSPLLMQSRTTTPRATALPTERVPAVVDGSRSLISIDDAEQKLPRMGLYRLSLSASRERPITPQLAEIWSKLQSTFDMVIVAAPPVLDDPTAACLSTLVDSTVLVIGAGKSRRRHVSRAMELLTSGAAPLIGVVMTGRKHTWPRWIRRLFSR